MVPGSEASRVERRLLDTVIVGSHGIRLGHWPLNNHSRSSPQPFVDQFTAQEKEEGNAPRRTRLVKVPGRRADVRRQALSRADGRCQWCQEPGFKMADGRIFLETHHVIPIGEGGPDTEGNVVALCPNHHREAHYGEQSQRMREQFLVSLTPHQPML